MNIILTVKHPQSGCPQKLWLNQVKNSQLNLHRPPQSSSDTRIIDLHFSLRTLPPLIVQMSSPFPFEDDPSQGPATNFHPLLHPRHGKIMHGLSPSILDLVDAPDRFGNIMPRIPRIEENGLALEPMKDQVLGSAVVIPVKCGAKAFVVVNVGCDMRGVVPPSECQGRSAGAGGIVAQDGFVGADLEDAEGDMFVAPGAVVATTVGCHCCVGFVAASVGGRIRRMIAGRGSHDMRMGRGHCLG